MAEKTNPNKDERFGITIEIPDPFLQKHLEAYQEPLLRLTEGNVSQAVYNGAILKAGILAGFVTGVSIEEIPGLRAGVVRWASVRLHGMVEVAIKVPPA